jgi:hypothetical protein
MALVSIFCGHLSPAQPRLQLLTFKNLSTVLSLISDSTLSLFINTFRTPRELSYYRLEFPWVTLK